MLSQKVKENKSKWSFFKNLDIYAKPITMKYRGKEKFRSKFGGFISLAILVFIILIFSYKLRVMVNRTNR